MSIRPNVLSGFGDRLLGPVRLGEIGGDNTAFAAGRFDLRQRLVEIGLRAADADDLRALGGEQLHAGAADARSRRR